ncbi:interleukin-36 gamma-like [Tamandua tetradactyla]|uniref:interleukin-36 gamma-like n=1 Tax=Tamandua tetradactyla TaxID=48850 RepID=UPI0040537BDE
MKGAPVPQRHHQEVVVRPDTGRVSDRSQQVWTVQGLTLVAVPRSDNTAPARVVVLPCRYPEALEQGRGVPIYLGIENPEMCLACEDTGGQRTLQLKEQKILDLYNRTEPVKPFLFYHLRPGQASTFESVAFPGWFIASSGRGQPLRLTAQQGGPNNTAFEFEIES